MWDLHHYFNTEFGEVNIQFDVSFFKNIDIPYTLPSYKSAEFNNRIPDFVVNILSKSTWKTDLSEHVDICKSLEIPVYALFPSYHVTSKIYKPPFLRVYLLQSDGSYKIIDLRKITIFEDSEGNLLQENQGAIIDVSDKLPFRLGLMKRGQKHQGDLPLYRVIFIKPDKFELFLTKTTIAEKKAEEMKKELLKAQEELAMLKKQPSKSSLKRDP